jgi:hypothetical protein
MTRRTAAFARAFVGRWRIVEMDQWEDLDLLKPAHIPFVGNDSGELVFVAVEADLDVRYGSCDGAAVRSSRGKGPTITATQAVAAWRHSAPLGASSTISSSTKATLQALSPSASDFFNSLLGGLTVPANSDLDEDHRQMYQQGSCTCE